MIVRTVVEPGKQTEDNRNIKINADIGEPGQLFLGPCVVGIITLAKSRCALENATVFS